MFLLLLIVGFIVYALAYSRPPPPHPHPPNKQERTFIVIPSPPPPVAPIVHTKEEDQTGKLLNRIYNPLLPPERLYVGKNVVSNFQIIGYVFNDSERYPLFGRPKFPGRTEKWEYYIIDETRNKLKIPFKSTNDNELYDGDSVNIPTLDNNFTVKIYDYDSLRYNPYDI